MPKPGDLSDFTCLFTIAEHIAGMQRGLGGHLVAAVDTLTEHRAFLMLHQNECTRSVRAGVAGRHLYPVQFCRGSSTGTLAVAPDPQDNTIPALADAQAQQLARICGAALCLLDQFALLRVLASHLTGEPSATLTPRQREVLSLIARGLADEDIIEVLHISLGTLLRHRNDLHYRLGVHHANDVVLAGYLQGVVSYIFPLT